MPTGYVALPIMLQSLMFFLSAVLWGWFADRFGRRRTLIITALMTIPIAPLYLLTRDYTMIVVFFTLQGLFGGGGMHTQWPHYLSERFPTEVRATATGFCYHQGAIFGGLVGPVLAYFATTLAHGLRDTDVDRHHRRRRLGVASRCCSAPRRRARSWLRIFNWHDALAGQGRTDRRRASLVYRADTAEDASASPERRVRAGRVSARAKSLGFLQRAAPSLYPRQNPGEQGKLLPPFTAPRRPTP